MIMKSMKVTLKLTSLIVLLGVCLGSVPPEEDPENIPAFMQSNIVTEKDDAIEAYQTENSTMMEAYISNVHYIDER